MNKNFLIAGIFVSALAIGSVAFFSSKNQRTEELIKISVALDWFPYAQHAGLYVAKENGYFTDEGLEVDIHTPADVATILQTVAHGRDDFGLNYQTDLLLARSEGLPVVSIAALVQHPLYALVTLKESGFTRPRDLEGKRVGHAGVPLESLLLDTVFKADGIEEGIEGVEFINVGYDALTGLLGGQLDGISAYYTNQPIIAEIQGQETNVMRVGDYGVPDYYESIIVANEEMVENNPDIVEGFLRAVKKGYEEAAKDPQRAIQLMVRSNPELDVAVANNEILLEAPLWFADNGVFGWQEESKWLSYAQWMQDGGLLTKHVDARQAFTNSFIESLR
jgi:putative hydroxymethylpyrimidine transport system substrate-binding protein